MQHMLSVSFFLRKTRKDENNQAPIICRLKLYNIVRDCSTGLKVNIDKWNSQNCLVTGKTDEAKRINGLLEVMRSKYFHLFSTFNRSGDFELDDLIDSYNGKDRKKEIDLLKLGTEHNQHIKKRIGIDYAESTYEKYWAMEVRINQFVKERFCKKDVSLRKLDRKFIADFFIYLKEAHHNQHNSATKTVKNLKRVLSYAVEQGYIDKNPFDGFQCGYKETVRTVLTDEELRRIEAKQFSLPRLELVKNLFLFQCYTGLSYDGSNVAR